MHLNKKKTIINGDVRIQRVLGNRLRRYTDFGKIIILNVSARTMTVFLRSTTQVVKKGQKYALSNHQYYGLVLI